MFTAFSQPVIVSKEQVIGRYAGLAKVWGFLKYYHPKVAKGKLEWDDLLVSTIDEDVFWKSEDEFHKAISKLMYAAGYVPKCKRCKAKFGEIESQNIDWSWLSDTSLFSSEISKDLHVIKKNHRPREKNRYIEKAQRGYRKYVLDQNYASNKAPKRALRLLALFHYWNVIEYFYPYKFLESEPWDNTLYQFIPILIKAESLHAYYQNMHKLTKQIRDSHADFSHSPLDNILFGTYRLPISLSSLPDTSIWVKSILIDSIAKEYDIQAGDRIVKLDGVDIDSVIHQISPFIASSNTTEFRRYLCSYLSTDTLRFAKLILERNGREISLLIPRYTHQEIYQGLNSWTLNTPNQLVLYGAENDILYVNMGRVTKTDIDTVIQAIFGTKGLIFDLRHGLNIRGDEFVEFLADRKYAYTIPYLPNFAYPGYFLLADTLYIEGKGGVPYPGKIVILVDESVQSISEISTMLFQALPGAVVMGIQTSGTVSTISLVELPYGFQAIFTNVCLFYPDGALVQGEGVRINIPVSRTYEGIKGQKDEILQAALNYFFKRNKN